MYLFKSTTASHEIHNKTYTSNASDGLKLKFAHFEGRSPYVDGSIRTVYNDKIDQIQVSVLVTATSLSCELLSAVLEQRD